MSSALCGRLAKRKTQIIYKYMGRYMKETEKELGFKNKEYKNSSKIWMTLKSIAKPTQSETHKKNAHTHTKKGHFIKRMEFYKQQERKSSSTFNILQAKIIRFVRIKKNMSQHCMWWNAQCDVHIPTDSPKFHFSSSSRWLVW